MVALLRAVSQHEHELHIHSWFAIHKVSYLDLNSDIISTDLNGRLGFHRLCSL